MSTVDRPSPGSRSDVVHRQWPADPRALGDVRRTVGAWLGGLDVSSELSEDLVYAVSEAASNAVEHAYRAPDEASTVVVTMWVESGVVNIEISDRGSWLPETTRPTSRGHGFQLIRSLVDSVSVESGSGGTTVSLRHRCPEMSTPRGGPLGGG